MDLWKEKIYYFNFFNGTFIDRHDAGKQLAEKLSKYRGKDAVILALP